MIDREQAVILQASGMIPIGTALVQPDTAVREFLRKFNMRLVHGWATAWRQACHLRSMTGVGLNVRVFVHFSP